MYPDPAEKTNANYGELVRLIPTDLGDHLYPGNKVHHYLMNKVKYMNHRRPGWAQVQTHARPLPGDPVPRAW